MWTLIIIGVAGAVLFVYFFIRAGKKDKEEAAQKAAQVIQSAGTIAVDPLTGAQSVTAQVAIPVPEKPSSTPRLILGVGALMLIIGPLFPVVTLFASLIGSQSLSGYQGDGIFQGVAGGILFLIAAIYKGKTGKMYSWPAALIAVAILIFSISFLVRMNNHVLAASIDSEGITSWTGAGLYVPLIGSCIATLGSLLKA